MSRRDATGPDAHRSDEELLAHVASGDTEAFDCLYDRYSNRLLQYLARMVGQDRAQDLLQELFIKLLEAAPRFRRGRRVVTWLFRVAHNMSCNEYRHRAVRSGTVIADLDRQPDRAAGIEHELDCAAFRETLLAELDRLDALRRSTFLLRFEENFRIAEIARMMDCPVGTVKSRLFSTLRLLADRLRAYAPCLEEDDTHD